MERGNHIEALILPIEEIKEISLYPDDFFRRLTGVNRLTFEKMLDISKEFEIKKKAFGGKSLIVYLTKYFTSVSLVKERIILLYPA